MPITLELMPLEEKLPAAPPPKTLVVRYGHLRWIGEFTSDLTAKVGCGSKLVARTERGIEIVEMLTTLCGNGGCNKSITRDKMLEYIENSGGNDYPFQQGGRVLRVATAQDLAEQQRLDSQRGEHLKLARELVQQHRLAMKIIEVEYLLGRERICFYFGSEHRVDFRHLVRDLARSVHTRIELRQVGARDEARLVADYEKCGQHCCCKQFLKVLTPISMRSAKIQKATLDPAKISGRCGRLMCCLRYEDQTYEDLRKRLPKRNTFVRTAEGVGMVMDGQILTQLVLVEYGPEKQVAVPMEHILEFDVAAPPPPPPMPVFQRPPPRQQPPAPPGGKPAGGPPQPRGNQTPRNRPQGKRFPQRGPNQGPPEAKNLPPGRTQNGPPEPLPPTKQDEPA